jgi:hypothetical protein
MDHDLLTHPKRFNDFMDNFERIEKATSSGIYFDSSEDWDSLKLPKLFDSDFDSSDYWD